MKLANDKLTEARRKLFHEFMRCRSKWSKERAGLLLKNLENLDVERGERDRLYEALRLNEPPAKAYYMKEDLRQLLSQPDKRKAAAFLLEDWIERALDSDISPLATMGKTTAACRTGILARYDHPISSGPMEGSNNKIKKLKRMAYGYSDMEFFKLRIMAIHEAK